MYGCSEAVNFNTLWTDNGDSRVILAICFLAVWFVFALLYQRAANESVGDDFTFAGDIKVKSQIDAFRDRVHSIVDSGVIYTLITKGAYQADCSNISPAVEGRAYLRSLCDQPMGYYWALYYENSLYKAGFRSYFLKVGGHESPPAYICIDCGGISHWAEKRPGRPLLVDPYPMSSPLEKSCCLAVELTVEGPANRALYRLWTTKAPTLLSEKIDDAGGLLGNVLKDSIEFLDTALWKCRRSLRESIATGENLMRWTTPDGIDVPSSSR